LPGGPPQGQGEVFSRLPRVFIDDKFSCVLLAHMRGSGPPVGNGGRFGQQGLGSANIAWSVLEWGVDRGASLGSERQATWELVNAVTILPVSGVGGGGGFAWFACTIDFIDCAALWKNIVARR
jgi:hypothetical protein